MVNPLISVILPTYNRIASLKDCIHSLLNQSYTNWELIIVDDSSNNGVKDFIASMKMSDDRIIYYKNKTRKGLPGSRNMGISLSKGNLILFIEDDIIMEPDAVEVLMESYKSLVSRNINVGAIAPSRPWLYPDNQCPELLGQHVLSKRNSLLKVPCIRDKFTGVVYSNFSPSFSGLQEVPDIHSCSLYLRQALEDAGFYDEHLYKGNFLYEETDLNYRICNKGYRLYFEPRAVLYHKVTSNGGCRVNAFRYNYFFVLNHLKFVFKNYGSKSLIVVPSFLFFLAILSIRVSMSRAFMQLKRSLSP